MTGVTTDRWKSLANTERNSNFNIPQRLPFDFNATRLAALTGELTACDWQIVADEPAGHHAVPLVSVGGTRNIDYALEGPMQRTPCLKRCPEIEAILAAFGIPLSRCRLLRLASERSMSPSANYSYHAFRRWVIYLPLVTNPKVTLLYDNEVFQFGEGEAWLCDPAKSHGFRNHSDQNSIHLVIETKAPFFPPGQNHGSSYTEPWIEPYCFQVLEPNEVTELTAAMLHEATTHSMPLSERQCLAERIEVFLHDWMRVFERFGHDAAGELSYRDLILTFEEEIARQAQPWLKGGSGAYAMDVLRSMLHMRAETPSKKSSIPQSLSRLRARRHTAKCRSPVFDRPIFIISAPRSGSTLLFETLTGFPEIWTTGEESHELIESIPELHPAAHAYHSNCLSAADASPKVIEILRERFTNRLLDREGTGYIAHEKQPERIRFLEKTPKNALRIPFLRAVFPDARFLVLYRRPEETISSMLEGWRSHRFTAYQPLPGWPYRAWKFLLVPGWEHLTELSLVEIIAYQWRMAYQTLLDDLSELPSDIWMLLHYTDLVTEPGRTIGHIAQFAELNIDERMDAIQHQRLPLSSMTFSAPDPDKWRIHAAALDTVLASCTDVISRIENLRSVE